MLGHDLHLDRVAQVRLIRAIPKRCVLVGNLLPRLINFAPATEFLKNTANNRLDRIEDILLLDKAHL